MAGWSSWAMERQGQYSRSSRVFMESAGDLVYLLLSKVVQFGRVCAIVSGIMIVACCAYALTDAQIVARGAELPPEIVSLAPETNESFDLKQLQVINRDIIGWLKIDNTDIDYPVLQGRDNDYYLARNFRREWSTAGSVFLDYRNANDLSDDLAIIYGHRMSSGKMFSDVTKFVDYDYFNAHRSGQLFLGEVEYDLELVAFARMAATEQLVYDVNQSKNNIEAVRLIYDLSMWHWGDFANGKYVMLSTCDAKDKRLRDVLLAKVK